MTDDRYHAVQWAEKSVDDLQIPEIDRVYVIAVLVEAALMESPIRPLRIAITSDQTRYMITIQGYQSMIDLVAWVNVFMGADRHPHLSRVRHLAVQFPPSEGAYMVIEMEQGQWHDVVDDSRSSYKKNKASLSSEHRMRDLLKPKSDHKPSKRSRGSDLKRHKHHHRSDHGGGGGGGGTYRRK